MRYTRRQALFVGKMRRSPILRRSAGPPLIIFERELTALFEKALISSRQNAFDDFDFVVQ
jgi:hypothetical protein